jgi:hypothetical protein
VCRVGDYAGAVEVNKRAYEFDLARASHCMVPYLPEHNVNVLIYAARCVCRVVVVLRENRVEAPQRPLLSVLSSGGVAFYNTSQHSCWCYSVF